MEDSYLYQGTETLSSASQLKQDYHELVNDNSQRQEGRIWERTKVQQNRYLNQRLYKMMKKYNISNRVPWFRSQQLPGQQVPQGHQDVQQVPIEVPLSGQQVP